MSNEASLWQRFRRWAAKPYLEIAEENYRIDIRAIRNVATHHPQRLLQWWRTFMANTCKERSAEEKLARIKEIATTADGWPDGETFYRSAIEEIRKVLADDK